MRTFCTVSAPLEACAPPTRPLSPGSRFLALRLLGTPQPRTLYFLVEAKSRVREVYSQTCLHFGKQGMLDTELFGLAVLIDGEYMFADPESKLSKYGPKSWRSSHTHGLDANGRPLLELHFRVQFYIESPFILRDETTRHNYYLQLKANAVSRDVPKEYSEQSMILLGGLALQADLGDSPDDDCCPTVESPAILSSSSSSVGASSSNVSGVCVGGSGIRGGIILSNLKNQSTASNASSTISINARICNNSLKCDGDNTNANIKCNTISDVIQLKSTPSSVSATTTTTSSLRKIIKSGSVRHIDNILIPPASSTSSLATNSSTSAVTSSSSSSIGASNISSILQEYFRLEDYLPSGIHSAWSSSAIRSCHRENRGMSTADAELNYIRQACSIHEAINAHVYHMKLSKTENGVGTVLFVVYANGIRIYSENAQPITFLWPNITKLSFERKKFEIRSGDNKITLYSMSDEKNKMLLTLCKETHQFSMKIASRLKEAKKREEEENQCLDACYIYSRSLHLPYKNKNDQRISVISSTSSNTTSGIVSDRVHSEDELEIMINTPPNVPIAAPSTESLALAHLLDRPSVSRQTSSAGQVSLRDLEEHLAALSVRSKTRSSISDSTAGTILKKCNTNNEQNLTSTNNVQSTDRTRSGPTLGDSSGSVSNETDSPNSHHNIGSQCSSTCSTVVVATDTITLSSLAAHTAASNRRSSTSSSLELGFSHTAQNSAISEDASTCVEHEFRSQDDCDNDENQSGVYTLEHGAPPTETSGVYTMNSSEITGQSSEIAESESHESSHYGCFQPNANMVSPRELDEGVSETADSVDGHRTVSFEHNRLKTDDMSEFRLRSDSNISASGSFRGDGSDPTDNKHTLLTAEELTDLIVGRGTYPSRKTVSATLDSDCDYVTLPLTLEGDSYIQGHQDTAPTEDAEVDMMDVILPTDPPAPPKRIDSNMPHSTLASISTRMRSPPPYSARHETTGLCGPSIRKSIQKLSISSSITNTEVQKPAIPQPPIPIPLRDPPPYPQQPVIVKKQVADILRSLEVPQNNTTNAIIPEEVTARFITTRPHINILKAHTSVVTDNAKPSFAAPTIPNIIPLTTQNQSQSHKISQVTQASRGHNNLSVNSIKSSKPQTLTSQQQIATTIPTTIGIPIVPYNIHSTHKSISSIPPPHPPYHHEVKSTAPRTCVLLPVIKPRQYLPPPPPTLPRQPPPPPPQPQLATVYTGQLARSQIELYQQQLYSDVDYVIYPLQDPAVSQQEYLDAKQGSILAAMAAQSPPPPPYLAYHTTAAAANTWDTCKGHAIYRSTPYLPIALSSHSRYASTQNLSDTYVQLPGAYSPLYSPSVASLCSSYEPPPPPPLRPAPQSNSAIHHPASLFARSRSDDNILNSIDGMPKIKRLPPPPPPPYVNRRVKKPPMPVPIEKPPPIPVKPLSHHLNVHNQHHLHHHHNSHHHSHQNQNQNQQHQHQHQHQKLSSNGCSTLPHQSTSSQVNRRLPISSNTLQNHQKLSSSVHNVNIISSTSTASTNSPTLLSSSSSSSSSAILTATRSPTSINLSSSSAINLQQLTMNLSLSSIATTPIVTTMTTTTTPHNQNNGTATSIDIQTLREKSKNMDLPLISALCNDRSLLKQTKAFVMPKHPKNTLTSSLNTSSSSSSSSSNNNNNNNNNNNSNNNNNKLLQSNKYPVSGLSTTQLAKPRKTTISHRHPNDKLPPLPMQTAEANNYVMDPTPSLIKHKSYNSTQQQTGS